MPKCDFNKVTKQRFDMGVFLKICCMFLEHFSHNCVISSNSFVKQNKKRFSIRDFLMENFIVMHWLFQFTLSFFLKAVSL